MDGKCRRLLGLWLPTLPFGVLDATLTLRGQSAAYWAGDYQQVNELTGFLNQLLQIHPAAFIAFVCVEFALFGCFILLVSDGLALWASISATLSWCLGASTWILPRPHYGVAACQGLYLLAALLLMLGIRYAWRARPDEKYELRHFSPRWRGVLATGIVVLFVYLNLWPH